MEIQIQKILKEKLEKSFSSSLCMLFSYQTKHVSRFGKSYLLGLIQKLHDLFGGGGGSSKDHFRSKFGRGEESQGGGGQNRITWF